MKEFFDKLFHLAELFNRGAIIVNHTQKTFVIVEKKAELDTGLFEGRITYSIGNPGDNEVKPGEAVYIDAAGKVHRK